MDEQKIKEYKAKINLLLKRLKEKYSEELDYNKIIPLFKEADREGIRIEKDLGEQYKRYYKIVNAHIEKISAPDISIKTDGPVTPEQFIMLLEEREGKIKRYKKRLDFLIRELEKGYSKEAENSITSVFDEAEKDDINPKKDLKGESERYRLLLQIYKVKLN